MIAVIRCRLQMFTALALVGLLCLPAVPSADTAQYFYDELGRLVGVVDGSGNAAVYNYDAVGNLLSIQRFTAGTGIGIFLIAPTSALVGTNVEIKGFGFDPTPANNQVKFNGATAAVVSVTATSIVATVPSGATTGSVTVANTNGTATSPNAFTVLVPPIISAVEPPGKVPQGATSRVVITGFNLAAATAVTFTQSGLSATLAPGATDNSLPVNVNVAGTVPLGSYPFSVVTPAGTVQSGAVTLTVAASLPVFNVGKVSVFKQGPPAGTNFSITKASVLRP